MSRFRYVDVIGRLRSISRLSGEGEGGKMAGLGYTDPGGKGGKEGAATGGKPEGVGG